MSTAHPSPSAFRPITALSAATTALFVPGDRPDRFAKALASGADLVIVDLEDAVAGDRKALAREAVVEAVAAHPSSFLVRLNGAGSPEHAADLELLATVGSGLLGVALAKTESPEAIEAVRMRAGDVGIVPLVESAAGLAAAPALAQTPGVARLALGAIDLALDLDTTAPEVIDFARFQLTLASRVAGLSGPLDSPSVEFAELEPVRSAAARARSFGFGGKLCIHPRQLAAVQEAFAPTAEEVEWAERILSVQGEGVASVDGSMVDRPVTERARRILAGAEHMGRPARRP
ncbi:CoA ester lyase [Herbiconiux sp. A18JL235]|uniref:CoA ester lyase n=1 Tax=Herbiconiux sp. A18JL235 TaxID=3152363 RepID=A0AB39BHW1_9MICO